MARGYRQRLADATENSWRQTRWIAWELRNGFRAPGDAGYSQADILKLPGDEPADEPAELTPEEIEVEFARVSTLDKDLL